MANLGTKLFDFDVAFSWLNEFQGEETFLGLAQRELYNQFGAAQVARDFVSCRSLLRTMEHFGANLSLYGAKRYEIAETYVYCAYAQYSLMDIKQAKRCAHRSISAYSDNLHNQAVACWLLGVLHLHPPEQFDDALFYFDRSFRTFSEISQATRNGKLVVNWYNERCKEMAEAMEIVVRMIRERNPIQI